MNFQEKIDNFLTSKPFPIKEVVAFVLSISPAKLNLSIFYLLPKNVQKDRLVTILKKLKKVEISDLPVVKTAIEIVPRRLSVREKLKLEYPKLDFDLLPEKLQIFVIKRFAAKERAVVAHAEMLVANDDATRLKYALACVDDMAFNWDVWAELDNYARKGEMLGQLDELILDKFQKEIDDILINKNSIEAATLLLGKMRTAQNRIYVLRKNGQQRTIDKRIAQYNFLADKLNKPKWENR